MENQSSVGTSGGKGLTESEKNKTTDWRKLFSVSADQTLSFLQPQSSNGRVQIPSEILEEGELKWRNAVVAQFVGRIPNFNAFQKLVNVLWGEHGKVDLRPARHNLFIIQFPNAITTEKVLESGPWNIQNQHGETANMDSDGEHPTGTLHTEGH